jgi:hypothetical protein
MIIALILAKSMPSLVAQGMLFFGFIYVFAKILDLCSDIRKDKKARKVQQSKEVSKPKSTNTPSLNRDIIVPIPPKNAKKRYLLEFDCTKYLMHCLNSQNEDIGTAEIYTEIKPVDIDDKTVFYGVSDKRESIKVLFPDFGKCTIIDKIENYHARFEFKIDDLKIDENELELIPIEEKDSMFLMNSILYKGKNVTLMKIPENYDTEAVKSSIAFDNYINRKV